jgi:hypothetical protein
VGRQGEAEKVALPFLSAAGNAFRALESNLHSNSLGKFAIAKD